MKTRKSINYAYPTSPTAESLGFGKTGCFYVAVSVFREGASWSVAAPVHNAEGFLLPHEADLIASYLETDGEPCPYFLKRGNPHTLRALSELCPVVKRVPRKSASSRLSAQL